MQLSKFNPRIVENKYYLSILIFICCFFFISQAIRYRTTELKAFIMDELVDTQMGVCVSKGYELYSNFDDGPYLIRTPLLTYIISVAVDPTQSSYGVTIFVRKIMWLCSVLIFLFTYLASRKFKNNFYGMLSLLLLCCFTTFLERSFRIRADLLSTLFSMPALVVLCGSVVSIPQLIISGFCLSLAFLTTQKAIYFILSFYAAIIVSRLYLSGINTNCFKKIIVECLSVFTGLIIPVLIFLIVKIGTLENFLKQCFSHAVHAGLIETIYSYTWKYLYQSLQQDLFFWVSGVIGIVLILFESIKLKTDGSFLSDSKNNTDRKFISLGVWSLSLLCLIINHKIKFPYVFINIAPTLSITGALVLCFLLNPLFLNNIKTKWRFKIYAFFILVLLFFPPIKWYYQSLQESEILKTQKSIMDRIDNITETNDAVLDGIGIAVTRKKAIPYSITARWYNERKAGAEFDIIEILKRTQPKALIKNYRFKRLENNEIEFIENHFVYDWSNIHVVGKKIQHSGIRETRKIITLLTSTKYAVLSNFRDNVLIDGIIPESVMFLSAGEHEIIIKGEKQDLLLKYFPAESKPLRDEKQLNLFPSY